jgi:hypothetical protein
MRGLAGFGIGAAAALIAGWLIFPRVLYVEQAQPFAFRHQTHAAKSGTTQCGDCHVMQADGEFAGTPALDGCAACHSDPMGSSQAEATMVKNYVKPQHPVNWGVRARQPANVRFSHAIHVKRGGLECSACHGAEGTSDAARPVELDRISGYSRETMSMSACEGCHRQLGFEAGCLGCHQ